jgi:3,4-dihydroxy-2-butanone 4-phosphate synthase
MAHQRLEQVEAPRAVSALRRGCPVVVGSRVGCQLVVLASEANVEATSFLIRFGSGFVVAVATRAVLTRLGVPEMTADAGGPRFHVAVDASDGITTGISARDRARTLRILADPCSQPEHLIRPGHVMPVRVDLRRPVNAENLFQAAAMVCEVAAGTDSPAAVVALESECGIDTADAVEGRRFADQHGLEFLTTELVTRLWHRQFAVGLETLVG